MSLVLFNKISDTIGQVTLNDPDNLNAMGEEMADEFKRLISKLKSDPALKVLILTGAGRAFSAGGNLSMLERKTTISPEENKRIMLKFYDSFLCILELSMPIIAALNGHAIGAGLCLASACDIRIASDKAKLGFTFTRLGLHPGMGATYFLPRVVGKAAAMELMVTGRIIEAPEALRLGLVSRVLPGEELNSEVFKIANEILECGPEAVSQLVQSVRDPCASLKESLEREASCQSINYAGSEFKEGVRAAIEKRKARF